MVFVERASVFFAVHTESGVIIVTLILHRAERQIDGLFIRTVIEDDKDIVRGRNGVFIDLFAVAVGGDIGHFDARP